MKDFDNKNKYWSSVCPAYLTREDEGTQQTRKAILAVTRDHRTTYGRRELRVSNNRIKMGINLYIDKDDEVDLSRKSSPPIVASTG